MYYILESLRDDYYADISGYLNDFVAKLVSPDDDLDQDLFRIRAESAENREKFPAFALTMTEARHVLEGNPTLQKYKVRVNELQQTNYRLMELAFKAKLYYSNYTEALRAFEYLTVMNTGSRDFTYVLPYLGTGGTTFHGSYQPKLPEVEKVTMLEAKGTIYRVTQRLDTRVVIVVDPTPNNPPKLILNADASFIDNINGDVNLEVVGVNAAGYTVKPILN